ncbi:hypothetical protein EDD18DRAFT_1312325 [Armillaria luteobubalina]|uniref:Protein kinase domain-containing protein n=1 Tax=Armillaria luteobubalina TaxID=153913 RepID=A0AA39PA82_9AGAR|nr:hypothetical protein EDD18DRAFT_1312325 [Armillaria luteobubalina]
MISKQLPDLIVPLIILELQRALGDDGWDALTQASYSVLSYWNDDSRTSIRDKCCCPTLILAGGGPYLAILGVVWTDKFIVQRLTDLMWLGEARTSEDKRLYKLARVFTALGRCYEILDHYYEDIYDRRDSIKTLIVDEPHPRFFPYYTSFKRHDGVTTEFEYVDALESDPTTVTFLAKTTTGKPCSLVIKFVDRYGFDAHDHLASHKRAPALLYCGLLDGTHDARDTERPCGVSRCAGLYTGPWRMVVMEYIDGRTAQQVPRAQWPMSAYNDVKAALTELHKANYVFGDLRQPNVMFNVKGKALLIDFDWAGTVGEVCYPKGLASAVNWPKGVTDFAPIEKEHDEAMLETYFSVKSIN